MEALDLQEIHRLNLELLIEFDDFCRENDIDYTLSGGTLLGAIRHKGFIPWDDDIDVMLLRSEYEKLLKVKNKVTDPDRAIISLGDKTFYRNFARYVRKDYEKHEEGFIDTDCPWIGIDIFPIENVPADEETYAKQVSKLNFYRKMLMISLTKANSGKSAAKKLGKNLLRPIAKMMGSYRIACKLDQLSQMYDGQKTGYIAAVSGINGAKERWPEECYTEHTTAEFEGRQFPIPVHYEVYLKNLYGNYMELPPVEKRKYTSAVVYPRR